MFKPLFIVNLVILFNLLIFLVSLYLYFLYFSLNLIDF